MVKFKEFNIQNTHLNYFTSQVHELLESSNMLSSEIVISHFRMIFSGLRYA